MLRLVFATFLTWSSVALGADVAFRDLTFLKKTSPSLDVKNRQLSFPRIKASQIWQGVAAYTRKEYFIFLEYKHTVYYTQIVGDCVANNTRASDVYIAMGSIPFRDDTALPRSVRRWAESLEITQTIIDEAIGNVGFIGGADFCSDKFERLLGLHGERIALFRRENILRAPVNTSSFSLEANNDSYVLKFSSLP